MPRLYLQTQNLPFQFTEYIRAEEGLHPQSENLLLFCGFVFYFCFCSPVLFCWLALKQLGLRLKSQGRTLFLTAMPLPPHWEIIILYNHACSYQVLEIELPRFVNSRQGPYQVSYNPISLLWTWDGLLQHRLVWNSCDPPATASCVLGLYQELTIPSCLSSGRY